MTKFMQELRREINADFNKNSDRWQKRSDQKGAYSRVVLVSRKFKSGRCASVLYVVTLFGDLCFKVIDQLGDLGTYQEEARRKRLMEHYKNLLVLTEGTNDGKLHRISG